MDFEIKLPLFEGPFDLLLFFIERDELEIHDIPIARITDEFLAYVQHLEKINIEIASEFILVASTLMRIKARTLLPRPELNAKGEEIDPRDELVKHLLEYKKYKSVVQTLAQMEDDRANQFVRGNAPDEVEILAQLQSTETELQHLDMYKLLKVYQRVIKRFELEQQKPVHTVVQYPYTIEQQREYILGQLFFKPRFAFADLLAEMPNKIAAIFNFLAILDLLQMEKIQLHIGEGFNNFWIERPTLPAETLVAAAE
jgi:segregation and condensation protein A